MCYVYRHLINQATVEEDDSLCHLYRSLVSVIGVVDERNRIPPDYSNQRLQILNTIGYI